jgi:hypothetical protein
MRATCVYAYFLPSRSTRAAASLCLSASLFPENSLRFLCRPALPFSSRLSSPSLSLPPLFPLCRGRPLTRVAGMSKQRITNWIDDSLPPLCVPASQPMTTAKHTMTQLLVAATIASRKDSSPFPFPPSLSLSLSVLVSGATSGSDSRPAFHWLRSDPNSAISHGAVS